MFDNRTPEQKYAAWVKAVNKTHKAGWTHVRDWVFKSPSGTCHDLSASDLDVLDYVEKHECGLVEE